MISDLYKFLSQLRVDSRIIHYDEASIKQAVIIRILQILGWDVFNIDEVCPEFAIEGKRVDYSLRINNSNEFFIEVKRPSEDLDRHQEQLLQYAFRQGVELAALTNGVTWFFYLPTQKGEWSARRFYAIDVLEQDLDEVSERFDQILSRENIVNGNAIRCAEGIYNGKVKNEAIKKNLPEAWNKIIIEPSDLIVDLLSESVEKRCGYKPARDDIVGFFDTYGDGFLIKEIAEGARVKSLAGSEIINNKHEILGVPSAAQLESLDSLGHRNDLVKSKPRKLRIQDDEFDVKTWADVDVIFIRWLIKEGFLRHGDLPIWGSKIKYFVNLEPKHSDPNRDGIWRELGNNYYVDVKYNAPSHIRNMLKTLEQLEISRRVKVSLEVATG